MEPDEIVMYLVVRTELGMSPGKVAAQVGHGVQLAIRLAEASDTERELLREWESADYPKVVLGASDQEFYGVLWDEIGQEIIPHVIVVDTGRTELTGNNKTVIAFCPDRRSALKPIVGHLRLYR